MKCNAATTACSVGSEVRISLDCHGARVPLRSILAFKVIRTYYILKPKWEEEIQTVGISLWNETLPLKDAVPVGHKNWWNFPWERNSSMQQLDTSEGRNVAYSLGGEKGYNSCTPHTRGWYQISLAVTS